MFESTSFGRTMDIMKRSLKVSQLRRDIIADNLANSDTPNFKRSELSFESQLRRALESESRPAGLQARMTHAKHIPFDRTIDYRTVQPRKTLDYLTQSKANGNNVDLEEEMMLSFTNQLQYQLMTQIVSTQFSQINLVLR
jgi:flagellar basal-body rod protein FlgB